MTKKISAFSSIFVFTIATLLSSCAHQFAGSREVSAFSEEAYQFAFETVYKDVSYSESRRNLSLELSKKIKDLEKFKTLYTTAFEDIHKGVSYMENRRNLSLEFSNKYTPSERSAEQIAELYRFAYQEIFKDVSHEDSRKNQALEFVEKLGHLPYHVATKTMSTYSFAYSNVFKDVSYLATRREKSLELAYEALQAEVAAIKTVSDLEKPSRANELLNQKCEAGQRINKIKEGLMQDLAFYQRICERAGATDTDRRNLRLTNMAIEKLNECVPTVLESRFRNNNHSDEGTARVQGGPGITPKVVPKKPKK